MNQIHPAVVGLGYVGLPLAVALGRSEFAPVIGFDVSAHRIARLLEHHDATGEVSSEELRAATIRFTTDETVLSDANFIIVAVPTPTDEANRPDYRYIDAASEIVGRNLRAGSIVVFESTVDPGTTENRCAPIIERTSGLAWGRDWKIGYSPERINPGDKLHTLQTVIKVVAGEDAESLETIAHLYAAIVPAGIFRAASIKVAEMAKASENTQRDGLIALMNELALMCRRLGISIWDVLAAAGTKWNFVHVEPGMPGGHCIPEDPHFLAECAARLGFYSDMILAGRRRNDEMACALADHAIESLAVNGVQVHGNRVLVCGVTYKPNVRDVRNSQVRKVIGRFRSHGFHVTAYDPVMGQETPDFGQQETIFRLEEGEPFNIVFLASPHQQLVEQAEALVARIADHGVFYDYKNIIGSERISNSSVAYVTL